MTYPIVTPYLKGFHLTLAAHHPGRNESGWKINNQEWSAYLHEAMEGSKLEKDKAQALEFIGKESIPQELSTTRPPVIVPLPPKHVVPVPRLQGDTQVLDTMFSQLTPSQTLVRASRVYSIIYGFADASGSRFGSTFWEMMAFGIASVLGTQIPKTAPRTSGNLKMLWKH